MGESTASDRREQCRKNARAKSEAKRTAAFEALAQLQRDGVTVTKRSVAVRAQCSLPFFRNHPDLLQAIEEAGRHQPNVHVEETAKNQVVGALRRRIEALNQQLSEKDAEIARLRRENQILFGKLASKQ